MLAEVAPAGLGDLEVGLGAGVDLSTGDLVGVTLTLAINVGLDVLVSLLNVTGDVEGITGSLRDGETVYTVSVCVDMSRNK